MVLSIALMLAGPGARAETADAPASPLTGSVPFGPVEAILLRSTLIAIAQANSTGQYAVLRALMDPAAPPPAVEGLAELFKPWRDRRRDIGFAAIADPELSPAPAIDDAGALRLAGTLPTPGFLLRFDLEFRKADSRWRLSRFRLNDGETELDSANAPPPVAAAPAPETILPAKPVAPAVATPAAQFVTTQLPPLPPPRPAF